jgi:AcrR family transcriptional regulator
LSNAGLLHHFASKEQLFLALLEELESGEARFMGPLVEAAEREAHGDRAPQAVLDVLRTIVVRSIAQPQLLRFLAKLQVESLDPSHPAHEWWRRRERLTTDFFAELLRPYVDDPMSVARQLLAMMDGLCLRWLWADRTFDAVAEWERALASLAPKLAAPGA